MENNEIMVNEEIEVMDNDVIVVEEESNDGNGLSTVVVAGIAFGVGLVAKEAFKLAKKGVAAVKAKSEAKKEAKKHKSDNVVDVEPQDVKEVVDEEETSEK